MSTAGAWFVVLIALFLLGGSIVSALQGAWLPAIWFAIMWFGVNYNSAP